MKRVDWSDKLNAMLGNAAALAKSGNKKEAKQAFEKLRKWSMRQSNLETRAICFHWLSIAELEAGFVEESKLHLKQSLRIAIEAEKRHPGKTGFDAWGDNGKFLVHLTVYDYITGHVPPRSKMTEEDKKG